MIAHLLALILSTIHPGQSVGSHLDQVLEAGTYGSDSEARTVWTSGDGGLPVLAGSNGLRLPCRLTNDTARASWDRAFSVNLSRSDRISFDLTVPDPTLFGANYNIYFQSGSGWYRGDFTVLPGLNHVHISKADFGVEEHPAGWSHITGMRICAWRTRPATSELVFGNLSAYSSDIAIISGVEADAKVTQKLMDSLGIECGGLSDVDVADGALSSRKIAILPDNPTMSPKEIDQIEAFVAKGGKVIAFYAVDPRVMKLLGVKYVNYKAQEFPGQFASFKVDPFFLEGAPNIVRQASWNVYVVEAIGAGTQVMGNWHDSNGQDLGFPALVAGPNGFYMSHVLLNDDGDRKQRLLLAMVGRLSPTIMPAVCSSSKQSAGKVADCTSLAQAISEASEATKSEIGPILSQAEKARLQGRFFAAMDGYERVHRMLVDAYCRAQSPVPNELRSVWCHSAFGVPGYSWQQTTRELKLNGINALFPNMLWGGIAYYPSKVLPVDAQITKANDPLAACVEGAKQAGIQVHVWKVNWNLINAPASFVQAMRLSGRTQKDPSGHDIDWLCPSHPDNQRLELDAMTEVATNYAIDGLHFDYIRYPDASGCYCQGCRERFERLIGEQVKNWPRDVTEGKLRDKYREFRRSNITRLVRSVSERVRKLKPKIKLSAAVFSDWPNCRDTVGQDWVEWLNKGYLDFVCPMNYTPSSYQYEQIVSTQRSAILKGGFCPGVGVTLESTLPTDQVVKQILLGRKHGSNGFILFNLNNTVLNSVLPQLRLGITRGN